MDAQIVVTVDIQDVYNNLSWDDQKKFLLENINDLDIDELIDNIGEEKIISCLKYNGYSVVGE
ncbi:MAG: hypothetical protein IJ759_07940 [Bacteroidales bacterium]|nr:hypothetical protein [Bacteroidales bacterium]